MQVRNEEGESLIYGRKLFSFSMIPFADQTIQDTAALCVNPRWALWRPKEPTLWTTFKFTQEAHYCFSLILWTNGMFSQQFDNSIKKQCLSDICNPVIRLTHLLFLVFCRNVRPETESVREKFADTMWTSVSSEINSPEPAKELKLRCIFFSTNETRCSGFGPVRLNSRRLLDLHACLQILILQNLPQTTITFHSTTLTFNIKQNEHQNLANYSSLYEHRENHGFVPVYQHWNQDFQLNTDLPGGHFSWTLR